MDLNIKVEKKQENIYVISLSGSLDTVTTPDCEEKIAPILESSARAIIFDMTELDYISSIGLAVIFKAKKRLLQTNGVLAIANLNPGVKRVFESMNAIPESIFESLDEANKYIDDFLAK